jgi:hypothetical protein
MRKRIKSASFSNYVGTVVFEDGTSQGMMYEEYLLYNRNYTPRSVADLIRHIQEKGAFYDAGHRRPLRDVWTGQEYYWFHGKNHLTREEFKKMMALLKRYQKFCHYIKEIAPQWKKVDTIFYADNSTEEIQMDILGNTRKVMVVAPHGDACY